MHLQPIESEPCGTIYHTNFWSTYVSTSFAQLETEIFAHCGMEGVHVYFFLQEQRREEAHI